MSQMLYRKLGDSGLSVSVLSYGSWVTFGKQIDQNAADACIKYAFDHGVNFFDNAEVYAGGKSEELMGESFKRIGLSRNDYILTTKFFWGIENRLNFKNTLNKKYLTQAIDGSLKRLKTDFIDVVYCHRYDPETPIHEICQTMDQMSVMARRFIGEPVNGQLKLLKKHMILLCKTHCIVLLSNNHNTI